MQRPAHTHFDEIFLQRAPAHTSGVIRRHQPPCVMSVLPAASSRPFSQGSAAAGLRALVGTGTTVVWPVRSQFAGGISGSPREHA